MSHNVGVFVDVSNLFYSAKSAGVEVNYCRLLEHAVAGRDLIRACAYTGVDPDNPNQRRFIDFLRANGYKVICKDIHKYEGGRIKANLDIEMAVDIMLLSENLDVVVIVSGDGDFVRLVEAVGLKGVRCEVISFGISTSNELIEAADVFTEISSLSGIFRNPTAGAQAGHGREMNGSGEVRGVFYSYSSQSTYALPAERVSGEKERERLRSATDRPDSPQPWSQRAEGEAQAGPIARQPQGTEERGTQSVGYSFATHDEPFMLPDAEACGDPHSIPLIRPLPFTARPNGNKSNGKDHD
ncbi:MAG: NYN domain-containing protein [Chloroflexia bacterium]